MSTVNVYLNFMGNTLEVFEFYKRVFGWEFSHLQKFRDIPNLPGFENMTHEEQNWVMHVELPLLGNMLLMGTDMVKSFGHTLQIGNNVSLSLNVDSKQEAEKYFAWISQNGVVEMPLQDAFWGAYFGMCVDQYGVRWMINHDYKK